MAKRGRLESRITVPSGGWDISVTGTSSGTATVPAGTYYLGSAGSGSNSFAAEVASKISTTTGDTVTVTISDGESAATGKTTIASDANLAITWTDTEVRNILGFTGDLTADTSHVSTNHCRHLWLPDRVKISPYGDSDPGTELTDARATQNGSTVLTLVGKKWQEVNAGEILWPSVSHAKARIKGESTTNESFEKFWQDGIYGSGPGATTGGPIRLYWDADDDDTYTEYAPVGDLLRSYRPRRVSEGWLGSWDIDLGRLVVQSNVEAGGGGAPADTSDYSLVLSAASTQYASITDAAQTGLEPAGDFTQEYWFKLASLPGSGLAYALGGKWTGSSNESYLFWVLESGGSYYLRMYVDNGLTYSIDWAFSANTSDWFHVAFRYDASIQWQNQVCRLNRADLGTGTVTNGTGTDTVGAPNSGTAAYVVGAYSSGTRPFDGKIDEVRFWDDYRTDSEIDDNWKTNLTGTEGNLQGYWRLENNYTDETSNGNDLTGTNSPTFSAADTPY